MFIHGRKAGGRSIKAALEPLCDPTRPHYLHSGVLSNGGDTAGVWNRDRHRDFTIFANVRNPWDRSVSVYRYSGLGQRIHGHVMGFEEFLHRLPDRRENHHWWLHSRASYSCLLHDDVGPIYDLILHQETLDDDFANLVASLRLPISDVLPHLNAGRRTSHSAALMRSLTGRPSVRGALKAVRHRPPSYRDYYDERTRRMVSQLFEDDIDNFRYTF